MKSVRNEPTLQVIARIQRKELIVTKLPKRTRLNVVEHLIANGYSIAETAALLNVADRTVVRDRHEIRARNAVFADTPGLGARLAGFLIDHTEAAVGRLRKLQRDENTKPVDRLAAERTASMIIDRCLYRLQSMGFLPHLVKQEVSFVNRPSPGRLHALPREPQMVGGKLMDIASPATSVSEAVARQPVGIGAKKMELLARMGETRTERRRRRKLEKRLKHRDTDTQRRSREQKKR